MLPDDPNAALKAAAPPSTTPRQGEAAPQPASSPRPPAVMGPMQGTNGRPPSLTPAVGPSDGLTVGQNPNSPFRLPGPPPPAPAPSPAPVPAPVPQAPPVPAPSATAAPAPAQPAAPAPVAPGAITGVPPRPQMVVSSTAEVPAGVEVDTQIGKAYKDPATGQVATTLNSAGKAGYQRALASQLQRFGSYYGSDDPGHPKPPLQPGVPMFNPDSGKWV